MLLLQMDNCYSENENKYIMSLTAFLVEKDIFKEVSTYLCFFITSITSLVP